MTSSTSIVGSINSRYVSPLSRLLSGPIGLSLLALWLSLLLLPAFSALIGALIPLLPYLLLLLLSPMIPGETPKPGVPQDFDSLSVDHQNHIETRLYEGVEAAEIALRDKVLDDDARADIQGAWNLMRRIAPSLPPKPKSVQHALKVFRSAARRYLPDESSLHQ